MNVLTLPRTADFRIKVTTFQDQFLFALIMAPDLSSSCSGGIIRADEFGASFNELFHFSVEFLSI